jgi:CDP-diacylglycerol--glycerol-3-phosphate 3-phosphatidyltransferase
LIKRSTIPNAITIGRIICTPIVAWLIFVPTFTARLISFILFLIAAFSDLVDGHLARKHGWISDFGKLVDPIADKSLVVATFVPFYILSHRPGLENELPYIGALPMWILLVIFGRELLITAIRSLAARNGVVIPAGKWGKHKAVWQNIFIGTTIFWYALRSAAFNHDWQGAPWDNWQTFHSIVFVMALIGALLLTVFSLLVYLWSWRKITSA